MTVESGELGGHSRAVETIMRIRKRPRASVGRMFNGWSAVDRWEALSLAIATDGECSDITSSLESYQ